MQKEWTYKGATEFEIPEGAIGFIYMMTMETPIDGGTKYVGRKLLTRPKTTTKLGKKKKTQVDSGWRDYWSSSPQILQWIEENGTEGIQRDIIMFVEKKGELVYAEEFAMYMVDALMSEEYVNSNIRSKIYHSWVKRPEFYKDILDLKKQLII